MTWFSIDASPAQPWSLLFLSLSLSLLHFLLLGLNTFEKKGLPPYLGHGIEVTGASVWGVWRQPERNGAENNLTHGKLCSSRKRPNPLKVICIENKTAVLKLHSPTETSNCMCTCCLQLKKLNIR